MTWVEVPDLEKGKLILSNISLPVPATSNDKAAADLQKSAKTEPEEVNGLRLFRQGENIAYSLMIYNAPLQNPNDDLRMQLEIFRGEERIYLEPWFPASSSSSTKDKIGIELAGKVRLDSLQPGVYELRAAIKTTKSNQGAQRAVSFIVAP